MRRLASSELIGRKAVFLLTLLGILRFAVPSHAGSPSSAADFFEKEVRPLLAERCFKCHGGEKTKAGLKLTSRAAILAGGDSGPAAVPGKPEQSLILLAVRQQNDLKMPPDGKLSHPQIDKLARWIEMGLPWPEIKAEGASTVRQGETYEFTQEQRRFWCFQPVRSLPPSALHDSAWPRAAIDRFVLARLEARGLRPAQQSDKRTLIRRATFDLTGLPPTPQEVEAFLADHSPEAFARVVDRLLASAHYGERWGRHWLDVVRYTDSFDARILAGAGTIMDMTEAYRYRDWVVDAFNRDLPYDQFIIHQIAGDVLPAEKPDEINVPGTIATGMLAIGNWGGGDADKEKLLTDIADDQIDVVGRAFLGLTLACARCHDHKFDPIPTEDYYGLAGIFFSTHILQDPGPKTDGPPMLRIPLASKSEMDRREQIQKRLAELEKQRTRLLDEDRRAQAKKHLSETSRYLVAVSEYLAEADSAQWQGLAAFAGSRSLDERILHNWLNYLGYGDPKPMMKPVRDLFGLRGVHVFRGDADTPSLVANSTDKPVAYLNIKLPPRSVAIHPGPAGGVAVAWRAPASARLRISGRVVDADSACGDGIAWRIQHRVGRKTTELASGDIANGGEQRFAEGKNAGKLAQVDVREDDKLFLEILPKANHFCDTTRIDWELAETEGEKRTWNLAKDIVPDLHQGNPHCDQHGNRDVWFFYDTGGERPAQVMPLPGSALARWQDAIRREPVTRDLRQAAGVLAREIQSALDDPAVLKGPDAQLYRELLSPRSPYWVSDERDLSSDSRTKLAKWTAELDALRKVPLPPIPFVNGAQEGGCPRSPQAGIHDVRIHVRGRYDRLGKLVPRHFPRIIAGDQQPPITQGSGRLQLAQWIADPKNPLTARVMANRLWQHHFGEGIVRTPGNFGKLGQPPTNPELLDYLARYFVQSGWSMKAMHRAIMLSATYQQSSVPRKETLEADPDNLLFGRMNRRRLEAEEIRDALLAVTGRLNAEMGGRATQDFNLPRRTLYLMTIRSDRSSFRELFDAADPTAVTDKRVVSTVAPQALFLLNNPFMLGQAALLGKRLAEGQANDEANKIRRAYQLLFARDPDRREIDVGLSLLGEARNSGARGSAAELTAWEEYAQVLLCLNE
ncbi:MAG TPA: PSD1 and planctomycete cytochrome C domain-containing protein, partial [Gemmataceae bacterium]|nr:PSD1 and planctomycete cytochrome C domain-containing protein [Gemmataceae bacterium]